MTSDLSPSPSPTPDQQAQPRSVRRANLWLTLILTGAAALRFYALAGQSFWADEGNSVVLATRSFAAIITAAAADIHPPAYYLLLKLWGALFGLSEIGSRSLSAVMGVLLVWFVYLLGRRLRGPAAGLIAASLAAINPFLLYYSQEARMYMLLALCAAITAYALAVWITSPATRIQAAILYGLAALLGLYTHYAFPIHLVTLNLVFLLWLWRLARADGLSSAIRTSRLWTWLGLQAVLALAFAPWLPAALRQLSTWPSPAVSLGPGAALAETMRLFNCGPIPCQLSPALLALELGLIIVALLPLHSRTTTAWLSRTLLLLWLLLPLAAMLAFGIFSPVFAKFLVIIVAPFLLLLAQGIANITTFVADRTGNRLNGRQNLAATLVALALTGVLAISALPQLDRYYHDPTVARDDYRGIAAYLKAVAGPGDAIILNAPGQIDAFSQYDHGSAALFALPGTRPPDAAATRAELDDIIAAADTIYAIYWASEQSDPDSIVATHLAEQAFKAWDTWVGNLRLTSYSAEDSPQPVAFATPPRFGESISLAGAGVSAEALQPGDIARALLRWQTQAPLPANYKITLQLLDPANQVVAQVDSEPVGGARPTTAWQPGDAIDDPYGLPIPLATPPGNYPLILAVYDANTGARLPIATDEGVSDALPLGSITIIPPATAPPPAALPIRFRQNAVRGPLTLLGHDVFKQGFGHAPETPMRAGDLLHLTTFWQTDEKLDGDYSFDLLLNARRLGRFPLAGPAYPTSRWQPNLPWRGEHTAALRSDLTPGTQALTLIVIDPDGRVVSPTISLGTLHIE